ncbi:hypothetical protein JCM11641_000110 [Rhodosporidiobolus odoratus]
MAVTFAPQAAPSISSRRVPPPAYSSKTPLSAPPLPVSSTPITTASEAPVFINPFAPSTANSSSPSRKTQKTVYLPPRAAAPVFPYAPPQWRDTRAPVSYRAEEEDRAVAERMWKTPARRFIPQQEEVSLLSPASPRPPATPHFVSSPPPPVPAAFANPSPSPFTPSTPPHARARAAATTPSFASWRRKAPPAWTTFPPPPPTPAAHSHLDSPLPALPASPDMEELAPSPSSTPAFSSPSSSIRSNASTFPSEVLHTPATTTISEDLFFSSFVPAAGTSPCTSASEIPDDEVEEMGEDEPENEQEEAEDLANLSPSPTSLSLARLRNQSWDTSRAPRLSLHLGNPEDGGLGFGSGLGLGFGLGLELGVGTGSGLGIQMEELELEENEMGGRSTTTPVSLSLSQTLPQPGTTVLPPALASQLPSHLPTSFIPSHNPRSSSLSSLSSFNNPFPSNSTTAANHSPHTSLSLPPQATAHQGQTLSQTNHTRILLLKDFDKALKTKDLQEAFSEWQDDVGGLKVKWRDDTSAWVVFGEPAIAKRAFLNLLTNPPSTLAPPAVIEPYTGTDVPQIIQSVANRPRSRSIAGQGATSGGGHSRRGSLMGSGGGSALGAAIALAQAAGPHGAGGATSPSSASTQGSGNGNGNGSGGGLGSGSHGRSGSGSWGRSSFSAALAQQEGRHSPETPGAGNGGIVAGEAPRRFGGGGAVTVNGGTGGHGRRESRSGSEAVAASIAGLTIDE